LFLREKNEAFGRNKQLAEERGLLSEKIGQLETKKVQLSETI